MPRVNILLFQARDAGDAMREHEESCFRDKLSLYEGPVQLTTFNLVTEPPERQACWRDYDVILVGGSGNYGAVTNSHSWFLRFLETLSAIVEGGGPLFCSCFGHQALARALGGRVISDRPKAELGTHVVQLNSAGQEDPLYHGFPLEFTAQLGHNDRVVELPEGAVNLASTLLCEVQSYRLAGRLVYATQFHPEMSHEENQQRAMGYLQVYDVEQTTPERLARMFRPSHEASGLMARFLDLVAQEGRGYAQGKPRSVSQLSS
jgi:GMP synthase (glutamine-hydrolysing)